MNVPYGFGLLEGAPNPDTAKLFMDFVLSLEGQELFFDAYVRPIRADELDQPEEFPDQSEYDEAEFALDQLNWSRDRTRLSTRSWIGRRFPVHSNLDSVVMSSQTHETETFTAVATALIRPETEQERERRRIVVMCLPFSSSRRSPRSSRSS